MASRVRALGFVSKIKKKKYMKVVPVSLCVTAGCITLCSCKTIVCCNFLSTSNNFIAFHHAGALFALVVSMELLYFLP